MNRFVVAGLAVVVVGGIAGAVALYRGLGEDADPRIGVFKKMRKAKRQQ